MKKRNFKKNLVSFSTASALVLSSLSGVMAPLAHADQQGVEEGITITSSEEKKKNNESDETSTSDKKVTDFKKTEESTSDTVEKTASSEDIPEQKNKATDEAIQNATATVNNLFDAIGAKVSNTKAQIDAAKQQVTSLPESEQKTALLEKVAQAQQAYDTLMKKWQVANETMDKYFVDGDIGNPKGELTTEEVVDLAQKLGELPSENITFLEGYTTKELWKKYDQLIAVSNAIPYINRLFINGKPNKNNAQHEISTAFSLVNRLVDGPVKQKLLEKVQEAQQAYNDAHAGTQDPAEKQAMEAVTQLFNGDTPKDTNTQEEIDAAKKKVEAVNDLSPQKTKLLEKIAIAQAALDDRINAFKVDSYCYGNVYMTGQYSGNIKKFKLIVDGKEYTPGFRLLPNNQFELYIGKKIASSTKTVTVKSFDEKGKEIGTREVSVQSPQLTVEEYTVGKDYIKGQVVGEAKKFQLIVDGKEFSPGFKLLANNNFEVYAKNKVTTSSKKVILKVLNAEGVEIGMQEITTKTPSLDVNYYKVNTDYITGSVTGNVKKFKLIVDGKEYFPGFKLLKNNQFEVYAKNKVSTTSKSITLVSLDEQGKEIVSKQVPIMSSTIEDALTTVNNLFDGNGAKVSNTKAQIDAAKQQVISLPESEQKTALLEKVAQAQQAYDTLMKKWQVANETMDKYFVDGDIGNPKGELTTEEVVDLAQKLGELPYKNITFLEGYTTKELWEKYDQLIAVSNAIPYINRLFFNGKPSQNNTQHEISTAFSLVNKLVDGPVKQKLLEKVQEAQQAYNDAHIIKPATQTKK
ncbi:immunoglobulin-like domain-containing protein [Enterococcus villorum]|uniref:immunoglobulin-like domain-containing protein n=1 Tax=Enterococcus villorum TaxID=112904 RepID=UPI001F4E43BD|nr:immunoglobulin-like domain-containing protein [Enterococcus villorum]